MIIISVVSPVYKAQNIINELLNRVSTEIQKITKDYEIILVDDGSPDNSWAKIQEACLKDLRVKGVKLSRNYGQHFAITAGIRESKGDYVIVMDCDLQDDPSYFKELFENARNGADIVYTSKLKRQHNFFKNVTARFFIFLFNYLADNPSGNLYIGNFSIISRKVANSFLDIKDARRHYLMILKSIGYCSTTITVEHNKRYNGNSSYTYSALLKHAIDGISFNSTKLLWTSIKIGLALSLISGVYLAYILFAFLFENTPPGYASLMAALMFSTGIIILFLGIIGIYIGNIFVQVKNRPLYFIDKVVN